MQTTQNEINSLNHARAELRDAKRALRAYRARMRRCQSFYELDLMVAGEAELVARVYAAEARVATSA